MSNRDLNLSFEVIYDKLVAGMVDEQEYASSDSDEEPKAAISEDLVLRKIEELCLAGYLVERTYNDDDIIYATSPGLKWPDFVDLDDPIKKQILLFLVDNPKNFFVLYNTQKGKSRISANEMKEWADAETVKVVSVVVVDNDKTLADQSSDGFIKHIGEFARIFTLSGNSKDTIESIVSYIDNYGNNVYCDPEYRRMPVVVALNNPAQIAKIVIVLARIKARANHAVNPSKLRYGILVDEADKTYPAIRARLREYIRDNVALHRLGFVSATDGDLLEEFEECYNAQLFQANEDSPDYRAMHTDDAVVHREELASKRQKPNEYAEMVMDAHPAHFMQPVELESGEQYFRKVIVNGNTSVADMTKFARGRAARGWNAITFNQAGLSVFRADMPDQKFKIKGNRLNEVIAKVYKSLDLHDKPLAIVGRRKVDRGLGFHYAPRLSDAARLQYAHGGSNGYFEPGEGLIMTDVILGHIEDKNTAVQKAGRGAGIIAHCPQYCGEVHYWTDDKTACAILNHNRVVDAANALPGASSVLQATTHARENMKRVLPKSKNTIPVKVVFGDIGIIADIQEVSQNARKHAIIKAGIEDGRISLVDLNQEDKRFDIDARALIVSRIYVAGQNVNDRRFKQFSDAHRKRENSSQNTSHTQYCIDIANDRYENHGFVNEPNVAWITYMMA